MNTFTIDSNNAIVRLAHDSTAGEKFTSEKGLARLASRWPAGRLVEIWNGLPGVRRIAKFKDRTTAVRRIWTRVLELPVVQIKASAKSGTKAAMIIELLREAECLKGAMRTWCSVIRRTRFPYTGKTARKITIKNDDLGAGFYDLLHDAFLRILPVTKGALYVCMSSSELHTLYRAFIEAGGH